MLASGFALPLGFMIFLALQSYDESRSGADAEATLLVQQVETAQFLPKGAATEFTGELVFYGRSVAGIEWDAIDTGTLGKRSTHSGGRCSARSDRGRVHARTTRPSRLVRMPLRLSNERFSNITPRTWSKLCPPSC